jgi:hypothetical protein
MAIGPVTPDAADGMGDGALSREALRQTAARFAEDRACRGYSAGTILRHFADPAHVGPHAALRFLGALAVREIVDDALRAWPISRILAFLEGEDAAGTGEGRGLPLSGGR